MGRSCGIGLLLTTWDVLAFDALLLTALALRGRTGALATVR